MNVVSGPQNLPHHAEGDADSDDLAAALSPARFRQQCAERGRVSSSSVEVGQENVIALLLQQQEEVLKEIRDQKKGLALSQSSKEEIARLVLSSLKSQHPQWPVTDGSPPPPLFHPPEHVTTAGRSKRATKKRRRRKPSCSSDGGCINRGKAGPARLNEVCASCRNNPTTRAVAAVEPPWFPQEDVSNHTRKTRTDVRQTVIRQSVEKQPERVEVSLDGLWLPSLPSAAGGSDAAGPAGADRWRGSPSRSPDSGSVGWADHDYDYSSTPVGRSYPTAQTLPRAGSTQGPSVQLRGDNPRLSSRRPVTVASQAPCRASKHLGGEARARASPHGDNRRSGAVTAGGGGEQARHAKGHIAKTWTSRLESSRYADGAGGDIDQDNPAKDRPMGWSQSEGAGGDVRSGDATPISQHTAAMLKRSRALVARAKAFCGQATVRSPAPHRGREEVGLGPEPRQGHNSDWSEELQGRDQGGRTAGSLEGGSGYAAAGEAGSILFASPSPGVVLSLRPPRDPDPDANADAVREGGPKHPSLLASTGDGADEGVVGTGDVGRGVGVAGVVRDSPRPRDQRKSDGALELAPSQPPSSAEEGRGYESSLPHVCMTVPISTHRPAVETAKGAAETAETAEAAGAAYTAYAAEAAEAAGVAGAAEVAGATEAAVGAGEDQQQEIPPGVAPGNKQHGSPSWGNASTRLGATEFVRQGSASSASADVATERNQGRNHGLESEEKTNSRRGRGKPGCDLGGGGGGGSIGVGNGSGAEGNSAKVDTEWENEIAKNILSLYQTKLKDELDKKRGTREEEAGRTTRGYLTAEEEEDLVLQQQHQHQQGRQGRQQTRKEEDRKKLTPAGKPLAHARSRRGRGGGAGGSGLDRQRQQSTSPPPNRRDAPSRSCSLSPQRRLKRATTAAAPAGTADTAGTARFPGMGNGKVKPRPSTTIASPARTTATVLGVSSNAAAALAGGAAAGGAGKARPLTSVKRSGETVAARQSVARDGNHAPLSGGGGSASGGGGDKAATGRGGFRGSRTVSVPTRGGGEAVVMVPKRPRPIWFAGSGAVQAEWSALPGGARVVRDLEGLEEQGRYTKYVAIVEGLLAAHLRADDQRGPTELVKKLWKQLVVTCTAFGVRNIENRRFERSLELLKRAEVLLSRQVLDKHATLELRAFVSDAYGLYYLRRGKSSAALDYVQKAMKTHARMQDWGHVTKCHLHSAVVLSKLSRHDEALRCLGQVLSMVEEGKLDVGGNSPQKLCLVAICYHNMAVEQLNLRHAGEACMSSQNARRLARLCLSYSNRWLHSFEGTHKLALAELARALPPTKGGGGGRGLGVEADREQMEMLTHLTEQLFS